MEAVWPRRVRARPWCRRESFHAWRRYGHLQKTCARCGKAQRLRRQMRLHSSLVQACPRLCECRVCGTHQPISSTWNTRGTFRFSSRRASDRSAPAQFRRAQWRLVRQKPRRPFHRSKCNRPAPARCRSRSACVFGNRSEFRWRRRRKLFPFAARPVPHAMKHRRAR